MRSSSRGCPSCRSGERTSRLSGALFLALLAGCGVSRFGQEGRRTAGFLASEARAGAEVVLAAGDIGRCDTPGDEQTAAMLDTLQGTILALGDLAYMRGTAEEFRHCYGPTWGRHRARTRPAPGNHEYYSPGAAPYFAYFGAAAGPPGRGYYSFDLGAWHVVSLNSNVPMGPGSPQHTWLRADLAAHPRRCTLAYFHHPRFSSGRHGGYPEVAPLWEVLYEAGADVVLQAHDHIYERFTRMTPQGRADSTRGLRSFVVGTGGASLTRFQASAPGSVSRYNRGFGVLKLTLAADRYAWAFLVPGKSAPREQGGDVCH